MKGFISLTPRLLLQSALDSPPKRASIRLKVQNYALSLISAVLLLFIQKHALHFVTRFSCWRFATLFSYLVFVSLDFCHSILLLYTHSISPSF